MNITRETVLAAVVAHLEERYERLYRASQTAREEATDQDNRAESKYDTRSLEAGYLANGQAMQAEATADSLREYRIFLSELTEAAERGDTEPEADDDHAGEIRTGSVVTLRLGARKEQFFIGLDSGGFDVEIDGAEITVLSRSSPLAGQLLGKKKGALIRQPPGQIVAVG